MIYDIVVCIYIIYIHNLIYSITGTTPRFPDFSLGEDLGLDCGKADERPGPSQGLDPSVSVPMEALHKTVHAHIFGHQNYSNDIFKWHFPGWSNALSKLKMSKSSKVKILNLDIFHSSKLHISCDYYYPLFSKNGTEAKHTGHALARRGVHKRSVASTFTDRCYRFRGLSFSHLLVD